MLHGQLSLRLDRQRGREGSARRLSEAICDRSSMRVCSSSLSRTRGEASIGPAFGPGSAQCPAVGTTAAPRVATRDAAGIARGDEGGWQARPGQWRRPRV